MDGIERLYHKIACPTLTKSGPCNCQPVIVADAPPPPEPPDSWKIAAMLKDRSRRMIRERHAAGESLQALAKDYRVPAAFVEALVSWQLFGDEEGARENACLRSLVHRGDVLSATVSGDVQTPESVAEVASDEAACTGCDVPPAPSGTTRQIHPFREEADRRWGDDCCATCGDTRANHPAPSGTTED